jgi:Alginate O-acetyl transferase AlgF
MNYLARKKYFSALFSIMVAAILWESLQRTAVADEAALYDNAPDGSAFIRLISLTESPLLMTFADKQLRSDVYCRASEFVYLPAGQYQQSLNGRLWTSDLKPNAIYSLVVSANDTWLIQEPQVNSTRKGMLAVYNFTSYDSLSIRTRKGGMAVFKQLLQGENVFRSVNPIKIDLSAFSKDQHLLDAAPVIFQAGVLSSLFLCGRDKNIESHWAMN